MFSIRAGYAVLIAVACLASLERARGDDLKHIDFLQTLQIAMERSPTLSTVHADLTIRNLQYRNSYSVFLPSLDLSSTAGLYDSRPQLTDRPFTSQFDLGLTETLYDNGVSITNYSSAKIQRAIANLNFRLQRDQLLLDVSLEYMRYSLSRTLFETQQRQFTIVNTQYKAVESQFHQGVKTRRDYLKFKTELRRSEIEVQKAAADTEKSRVELMRLMGFDSKDVTPFEFTPIEIVPDAVAVVPSKPPNLTDHYQYRIAGLQKKVLENDVQIVRRRDYPELFFTAGANYHRGDYLAPSVSSTQPDITSWNALLNLKFNIWDWGIRRRDISIAEAKKTQAENGIQSTLNSFSSDNSKLMLDLNLSAKNYSVARELLDLENKSYSYLDTDYRNGKVSYLDIVVGLRDLLQARVQVDSSYFDLRGQLLKYRYYEGRLYESLFEK